MHAEFLHLKHTEACDGLEEMSKVFELSLVPSWMSADSVHKRLLRQEPAQALKAQHGLWGRDQAQEQTQLGEGEGLLVTDHDRFTEDSEEADNVETSASAEGGEFKHCEEKGWWEGWRWVETTQREMRKMSF